MTAHQRRSQDPPQPDWVVRLLGLAAGGWVLFALVLLLWSSAPTLETLGGEGQHFVIGLALATIAGAVVAAATSWRGAVVGWAALVGTTGLLFVLEMAQLAVPVRSFQWEDLSFGVTGAALGGGVLAVASQLRRRQCIVTVTSLGLLTLLAGVGAVAAVGVEPLDGKVADGLAHCDRLDGPTPDWSLLVLQFTTGGHRCIDTAAGPMVAFGEPLGDAPLDGGLQLVGGGVASGPLLGLQAAIDQTGQLTVGVRLTVDEVGPVSPPVVLGRLTVGGDATRPLVQLLQRGPHLASSLGSGRPTVGVSSTLADALTVGATYEFLVTYADGQVATYLNGRPLATSTVEPLRFQIDGELTLELGQRVDERWEPFIGRIDGVVIANRVLDPAEITNAFVGQ